MKNSQPTSRQYWALKCATGIDYREQNLTIEQFNILLKEANEKSGYVGKVKKEAIPTILHYLASNESIETLKKSICDEIEIKSIISSVDINSKPIKESKKYIFLGSGCGFSNIEFDGRNRKAHFVIEKANEIRRDIDKLVVNSFDKKVLQYLKDCGNPIEALQAQNMDYKITYNQLIVSYLEKYYDAKDIWVNSRLD